MSRFSDYLKRKTATVQSNYYFPKGQPVYTEQKYNTIAEEGYNLNAYVFSCVRLIANAFASITPTLYQIDSKGEKKLVKKHPILDLLANPNEDQDQFEFQREEASFFLLAGKNYTHITDVRGNVKEIYNIVPDPNVIKVVSGGYKNPIGYFEVGTGEAKDNVPKRKIIYTKDFHPTKIYEGHPTAFSSSRAIDTNNAQMGYNLTYMQKGGVPPLVIKGATTAEQVQQMRDAWSSAYAGYNNAGQPFFPKGDVEIETLGDNPKDADWLNGIELTGRLIMMAFQVPPEMLGDPSTKQRANYEQAEKSFYLQCVIPLWRMFLGSYNKRLVPYFGDNLCLDIDLKKIDALQRDREANHKTVRQDYLAGGITRKEFRLETGRDEDNSGVYGDSFMMPLNVALEDNMGINGLEMPNDDIVGNNQVDSSPNEDEEANADR